MEPIVDETTLVPCAGRTPAARIAELARALQALDAVGAPRVLRSVRDAPDRDLGGGRGLRGWCFDPATPRDAGRLVATRLASQPYVDGDGGLFAEAEGTRAIEAKVGATRVVGVGLAALTEGLAITFTSDARPAGERLAVQLTFFDGDDERTEQVDLRSYALAREVNDDRDELVRRVDGTLTTGPLIVRRLGEVFPNLLLGDGARSQIERMTGSEPVFRQLIRHLRALDAGASRWAEGEAYEPVGVTYSVESKATLDDGALGPMRDFQTPNGFASERWSLHTKLTGGNGARLYFRPARVQARGVVLVGYFGDHLPTVRYRT